MNANAGRTLVPLLLRVKLALVALAPALAWAAAQAPARGDVDGVSVWQWIGVLLFSLLGWGIADLDKIAEQWNPALGNSYEVWKARLNLYKAILASVGAGIGTFFLTKLAPAMFLPMLNLKTADGATPEIPEMIILLLVAAAGFMGARWWTGFERKIAGAP